MDDLELEARLRTRLHARFDDAAVPPELLSNVSQSLATTARPVGLATRTGRVRLGWAAVAAAVVIAVAAIGIGKGLGPIGPGAHPTPAPSAEPGRSFVVLPPNGNSPDKAAAGLASAVMGARLQALGIGTFSSGGGYAIAFQLPATGPSDAAIRRVLTATGDVRFVPLPTLDYAEGKLVATVGEPLPKDEPALFGWDGITAVTIGANQQGIPELDVTLKSEASQAVSDYTTAHIGETFAIVVDGRVALLPMIISPITGGQIAVSYGQLPGGNDVGPDAEVAAILVGGELPEAWRGASVPVLITRDAAITAALRVRQGTIQDATQSVELSTSIASDAWQVVWNVAVVVPECPALQSCPWAPGPYLVKIDAATGSVIHVGALE